MSFLFINCFVFLKFYLLIPVYYKFNKCFYKIYNLSSFFFLNKFLTFLVLKKKYSFKIFKYYIIFLIFTLIIRIYFFNNITFCEPEELNRKVQLEIAHCKLQGSHEFKTHDELKDFISINNLYKTPVSLKNKEILYNYITSLQVYKHVTRIDFYNDYFDNWDRLNQQKILDLKFTRNIQAIPFRLYAFPKNYVFMFLKIPIQEKGVCIPLTKIMSNSTKEVIKDFDYIHIEKLLPEYKSSKFLESSEQTLPNLKNSLSLSKQFPFIWPSIKKK